jgi:hypothetical protein
MAWGARLTAPASRAFDDYVAGVERRQERDGPPLGAAPDGMRVVAVNGGSWAVTGGMLHHWRGSAMVPGAKAAEMLALLRDYSGLARRYQPEVVQSQALRVDGDTATIEMRFRKQYLVTVVVDAEFETRAGMLGGGRGFSVSRSRHIWELADGRRMPEGDDDGYLWRLNSYWSFEERPQGLAIECEAVSLTRDVPLGLGWLVNPVVKTLPRASLEFTLKATVQALEAK